MAHPRMYDEDDPLLDRVRRLCLAFPESTEKESHGRPVFFAGRRAFAQYGIAGEGDRRLLVHPDDTDREALLQHPRASVPPYLGVAGWLGFDLRDGEEGGDGDDGHEGRDGLSPVDWQEMAELVEDSYRRVALARMLRVLDGPG